MIETHCPHCGAVFDSPVSTRGGIRNCPECAKAVDVPGEATDTLWFLTRFAIVVGCAAIGLGVSASGAGPIAGTVVFGLAVAVAFAIVRAAA